MGNSAAGAVQKGEVWTVTGIDVVRGDRKMFDADLLRQELEVICRDQVGVVVSVPWLSDLVERKLQKAFTNAGNGWRTPVPGVVLTPRLVGPLPPIRLSGLDVVLEPFGIDLQVHREGPFDPSQLLSVIRFEFDALEGMLVAQADTIRVEYKQHLGARSAVDRAQPARGAILASLGLLEDEFRITEEGIRLLNIDTIARSLVDSIRVPEVLKAVTAFRFSGAPDLIPLRFDGKSYLVITGAVGSTIVRPSCPTANAEKEISYVIGGATPGGRQLSVDATPGNLPVFSPEDLQRFRRIEAPLFLFMPEVQLRLLFDQQPLPAIFFSDSGDIGPVSWDYGVTVALRRLSLQLLPAQVALRLDTNLVVDGQASARIKIGCVESHLGSVRMQAEIDLVIEVFPRYEKHSKVLLLDALVRSVGIRGDEVELTSAVIPWPLEEIVEEILEDLAGQHLGRLTGRMVNLGRFDLARLAGLGVGIKPFNAFTYAGDATSILLGLTYQEDGFPTPEVIQVPGG